MRCCVNTLLLSIRRRGEERGKASSPGCACMTNDARVEEEAKNKGVETGPRRERGGGRENTSIREGKKGKRERSEEQIKRLLHI